MIEFISSDYGKIETKAGNVMLKKKSPLFGNESIEGDITFPFTIPMTDELRAWLKHPERIEAVQKPDLKNIQIKRNGISILSGELKIGDADDMQVETTFVSGSSPLATLIKNMCLDDLDLGFQTFANETEMITYFNASFNGNVTTFPYYLPTIGSSETGNLNIFFKDQNSYLMSAYGLKTYMTPMLYYTWLLPKLFESLGYEFEDNVFINNPNLRELLFFSMHNINSQNDPLTIHYSSLLPHYKISTWLIDIQNAFGVKFLFDTNKQKVKLEWQIKPISDISTAKVFQHNKIKIKIVQERPSKFNFHLNDAQGIWPFVHDNMLPAVWEKKDIPKASENVNKFCYIVSEDKTYRFYQDYYTKEYITELVTDLDYYFGLYTPRNFITEFNLGNKDGELLSASSNIHPLHPAYPGAVLSNYSYLEEDEKTIAPYVLFATHVLHPNGDYAMSDHYLNDFAFTWAKSTWLLKNKIIPWWEFLRNAKQLETTILVSDVELANWDWTIPILINNIPCLVDEMEVPLSDEGEKMQCKITAWRL